MRNIDYIELIKIASENCETKAEILDNVEYKLATNFMVQNPEDCMEFIVDYIDLNYKELLNND